MSYAQYLEDQEYEFNAPFDYVREAYAGMIEDPETIEAEQAYYEHLNQIAEQDAIEARGGPEYRAKVLAFDWDTADEIPF